MALFGNREEILEYMEWQRGLNDGLERAAQLAEKEVILDAMRGTIGVRPFGKEIAEEIRRLKR